MEITLTTPAIVFPAISLLLLAYTNRFMALAHVVRTLVNESNGDLDENRQKQISNLEIRIRLIKWMQAAGITSIFCCVVSIILLYFEQMAAGSSVFVFSLILMMASLGLSLWEILMSGNALRLELERCRKK